MPETTSRNWDAFNMEELDRRHRNAEEERRLSDPVRAATNRKSKQHKKHGSQKAFRKTSRKQESNKTTETKATKVESGSSNSASRRVRVTTCVSLAKELEKHLQQSIFEAVKRDGANVKTIHSAVPSVTAHRVRLQIKSRLTKG